MSLGLGQATHIFDNRLGAVSGWQLAGEAAYAMSTLCACTCMACCPVASCLEANPRE